MNTDFVTITTEQQVKAVYPLLAQLRPALISPEDLVERWRRQVLEGYKLVALLDGSAPLAVAGYRVQENLRFGRFLYVDDLVTDGAHRGQGLGQRLLAHLELEAKSLRCQALLLDTPMHNHLGHRFYFRCGLLATALRFSLPLDASPSPAMPQVACAVR